MRYRNSEGYADPTAGAALAHISNEERRKKKKNKQRCYHSVQYNKEIEKKLRKERRINDARQQHSHTVSNLSGLFDSINTRVADVASTVGKTPQAWNSSIFNMIRTLSENVVVPIAGIILTFVMTLELIQLIIDRNNMHDFDTFIFFKWIMKTFAAILIVTNTWNIVMAVFDVAQHVVSQAAGVIIGETALDVSALGANLEARLNQMDVGPLFGLWFQSSLMGIIAWVLSICIFIIVYGRMIEIYMVTSIAPIPMATMANREWGRIICVHSWRWDSRRSSSWYAWAFTLSWYGISVSEMISAARCGPASDTRCYCVSRCLSPAASQNQFSMRINQERA